MSAAKKPTSKDKQNTNCQVQQIIRENTQVQIRPIIGIPEVEITNEKWTTVAANKKKISRGIKNKINKIHNLCKIKPSAKDISGVKVEFIISDV